MDALMALAEQQIARRFREQGLAGLTSVVPMPTPAAAPQAPAEMASNCKPAATVPAPTQGFPRNTPGTPLAPAVPAENTSAAAERSLLQPGSPDTGQTAMWGGRSCPPYQLSSWSSRLKRALRPRLAAPRRKPCGISTSTLRSRSGITGAVISSGLPPEELQRVPPANFFPIFLTHVIEHDIEQRHLFLKARPIMPKISPENPVRTPHIALQPQRPKCVPLRGRYGFR